MQTFLSRWMGPDPEIDRLIRPPVPRYKGFDWSQATAKLRPTGAAYTDRLVREARRLGDADV